jgi:hypothetical protein
MSAPVSLTIGGVDFTAALTETNFQIQSVLGKTVSTMQGTLVDKNCALAVPLEGVDLIVTRTDTGERIFGGLSANITGYTDGINRYWDIQGQSYTVLLDRTLLYMSYPAPGLTGLSDKDTLTDLFANRVVGPNGTNGSSEITVGSYVQGGTSALAPLSFIYTYAREAVELLAGYVGYSYYVDFNKNLHYYLKESIPAPFALSSTPGETLGGLTALGYQGLKWSRDATRIVNSFLVYGTAVYSYNMSATIPNDGVKTVVSTSVIGGNNSPAAPAGYDRIIVYVNTGSDVTPQWSLQTVGLTGIDTTANFNCMWDAINQTLTFITAPPNLTNSVKIIYRFLYQGGQPSKVQGSYDKYGRWFATRIVASDANSAQAMKANLNSLETQFSYSLQKPTLRVDDGNFPSGNTTRFAVGQYIPFKNAILGINQSYWIHSITTVIKGGLLKEYQLELRNWSTE